MADTRGTLEQIRDLLNEDPPKSQQALRLVKDLVIQGICVQELDVLRNASIMLLEHLVRPILAGDQEHQARIGRLIRQIRTDQIFTSKTIVSHMEAITPWISGQTANVQASDSTPPFPAALLQEALITLGGNELREIFPSGKDPDWDQLYLQLGSIIHRQRRSRSNWQREQRELQTHLAEMAQTLAESLRLIGVDSENVNRLANRLASDAPVTDFVAICDSLWEEVQKFQASAKDLRARLAASREVEERFRVLLRRAEWELLDVQDEKLLDSFTGIPNRFALLGYLERAMQFHREGAPGFTLVLLLIEEYSEIVRDLGRNRVNRLMASVAGQLTTEVRPGDYLARYNDETFALVCPRTGEAEAITLATQLRDMLDYTRFETKDAILTMRVAFGVVRHEAGEGTESLLGLGLMAAKEALAENGSRIRSVPPRQKPTPPPPLPAKKKTFGF